MGLTSIDWVIMAVYAVFVLGIGVALKRYMKTSTDFFLAGRSIPAWVCGLAFISANLGAQEVIGMGASGAKYGIATSHFYWIGAIPAMVFVGIFMMPFYYGSRARSVPEYLRLRFDEKTRGLNAISFATMTIFSSGISVYAMAKLMQTLHILDSPLKKMGLPLSAGFHISIIISAIVVLVYILLGGLVSAIYNEVLQFFLIVAGFLPLVLLGLKDVGGWSGIKQQLPTAYTHSWQGMSNPHTNPLGVEWFGLVMGLGFVSSFGYWCTDFLVVQRAMAAKNMSAARRTPLIAAIPKMLFTALVILPGMIAVALAIISSKDYHLPRMNVPEATYASAMADVRAANPDSGAAAYDKISKDIGLNLDQAKITAIIQANSQSPLPDDVLKTELQDAVSDIYYSGVALSLIERYCPSGLLGLALTALLASFMSGMAGNVTAFNTIWTYDLYQAYLKPNQSDRHYFVVGQSTTVVGIVLSIFCAYFSSHFNNAMNVIQLVFGFVNAPLFATFLLGMFWARTTGTGAFLGLILGTFTSALYHAFTIYTGG